MCEIEHIAESLTRLRFEFSENREVYIRFSESLKPDGFPIDAEEVVQEVHIAIETEVTNEKARFENSCSGELASYIRTRIRWIWGGYYRKLKTKYKPTSSLSDLEFKSTAQSSQESCEQAESERIVRECLLALESNDQSIIAMRFLEGMTYPEIGKLNGQSKEQIARRIARALNQLRECLDSKQSR